MDFLGAFRHTLVHLALHPNGLKQFTRNMHPFISFLSLSKKKKKKKKTCEVYRMRLFNPWNTNGKTASES